MRTRPPFARPVALALSVLMALPAPPLLAGPFGWVEDAVGAVGDVGGDLVGGVVNVGKVVAGGVEIAARGVATVTVQGWGGISRVGQAAVGEIEDAAKQSVDGLIQAGEVTGDALRQATREVARQADGVRRWVKQNEKLLIAIGFEAAMALLRGTLIAVGLGPAVPALEVGIRLLKRKYIDGQSLDPQSVAEVATASMPVVNLVVREHQNLFGLVEAALEGDLEAAGHAAADIGTTAGRIALRRRLRQSRGNPVRVGAALAALDQYERELGFLDGDRPPPPGVQVSTDELARIEALTPFFAQWEADIQPLRRFLPGCVEHWFPGRAPFRAEQAAAFREVVQAIGHVRAAAARVREAPACAGRDLIGPMVRPPEVGQECFVLVAQLDDAVRVLGPTIPPLAELQRRKDAILVPAFQAAAALDAAARAEAEALHASLQEQADLYRFYVSRMGQGRDLLSWLPGHAEALADLLAAIEASPFAATGQLAREAETAREAQALLAAFEGVTLRRIPGSATADLAARARQVAARDPLPLCQMGDLRWKAGGGWPAYRLEHLELLRRWRPFLATLREDAPAWFDPGLGARVATIEAAGQAALDASQDLDEALARRDILEAKVAEARRRDELQVEALRDARNRLQGVDRLLEDPALQRPRRSVVMMAGPLSPQVEALYEKMRAQGYTVFTPEESKAMDAARAAARQRVQRAEELRDRYLTDHLEKARERLEALREAWQAYRDLLEEADALRNRLRDLSKLRFEDFRAEVESAVPPLLRDLEQAADRLEQQTAETARRSEVNQRLRTAAADEPLLAPALTHIEPLRDSAAFSEAFQRDHRFAKRRADLEAEIARLEQRIQTLSRFVQQGLQRFGLELVQTQRQLENARRQLVGLDDERRREEEEARKRAEKEAADAARRAARKDAPVGVPGGFVNLNLDGAGVGISGQTRWQRAKTHLANGMRAYVAKDAAGFMTMFSPDALVDLAVLRNAALEDFQAEDRINIDFQLLAYRMTNTGLDADLQWNRNSVDARSGTPAVETGTSRAVFDRGQDFTVKAWYGSTPFGRRSRALADQVQAGQVNDETGVEEEADDEGPSTPAPPTQAAISSKSFTLDFMPNRFAVFDFEAGTVRTSPTALTATATEDLAFQVTDFPTPYALNLNDAQPALGAVIRGCTGVTDLTQLRSVNTGGLAAGEGLNGVQFYALKTAEGNLVLFEADAATAGTVELRWMIAAISLVNPAGTVDCP